jgi:two-component system, cell cycle sensor histidine kinase and response regulator CckA
MLKKIAYAMEKTNPWHFVWIAIVCSELIAAGMNALQSQLLWGKVSMDLLMIGAIDALFVPLVVAPLAIYFVRQATELRTMNAHLQHEVEERKRAEEVQRSAQERIQALYNSITDALFVHNLMPDGPGRFLEVNDIACHHLGYTREELLTMSPADIDDPESNVDLGPIIAKVIAGETATFEQIHIAKDGRRIPVEIRTQLFTLEGRPAVFSLSRDITERRRMEEELREKEMKYRSLFEAAKDGIFLQDETGFIDCNQKGAEMYGLTKEEIVSHPPSYFAPERQPDGRLSSEVAGEKIRAALSGIPQVFEWQPRHINGSPFDVEITLNRLELGGKLCLQAIVRDIGERKRLEQERLKTQKLEAIGTLAGGIAHDFNNLLQGVFGYISLAKLKRDDRDKSLAALEEAEKALHISVKLTNQLLTFSKGGKPLKKAIDLHAVIENAAKFALSGSRSSYHLAVADGLWMAEADEGQIGQVIQNVVLNADQAMPVGGQVMITARNVQIPGPDLPHDLEKGRYVEIAIRDAGIGISEQYLGMIFDPYFTTKEKGSGLGLATSYSIIKNHNGIIDVKSEVDKGTVFLIYLPATSAAKKIEVQTRPAIAAQGRKGRVLVMDDDPVIRDIAGELIRALGHSAESVSQGKEVIEKYQDAQRSGRPFDVVLLDLTIRGGMGGAETLQKLLEFDPAVKAVVSSGYSTDALIASYQEQGFKASLRKPYNAEDLRDVLNKLLSS